jgi:hypothetical protein
VWSRKADLDRMQGSVLRLGGCTDSQAKKRQRRYQCYKEEKNEVKRESGRARRGKVKRVRER